jgi:hypothetical protein
VRDRDRTRLTRLARDLAAVEMDEPLAPGPSPALVEWTNQRRAAMGLPPLRADDEPPELELYRRARSLGLPRVGR